MDSDSLTAEEENAVLRAQVMNLMGKLEVAENFIPQIALDLSSLRKLTVQATDGGIVARISMTHHMNLGS